MQSAMFILYVADQQASRDFYCEALGKDPALDVPGMTEFNLTDSASLGLMPNDGIRRLLGDPLPDPSRAMGIPRAEVYIFVYDPQVCYDRAVGAGASPLSAAEVRAWGDLAAYVMDPDGHVLAFACKPNQSGG